ncbi:hypothetical protein EVAR_97383_1 [Eumeta japonica]|uniref:Uncharacterized protein n=1 Tax=Eumeta variegata TaxID=151549 RepID=A0A4C1YZZ7_EUMVA|nr:hypothetical protein EVAR_97383_1 [Eumeta japonica]
MVTTFSTDEDEKSETVASRDITTGSAIAGTTVRRQECFYSYGIRLALHTKSRLRPLCRRECLEQHQHWPKALGHINMQVSTPKGVVRTRVPRPAAGAWNISM